MSSPLIGLFGTGRSGSTWLGSILDSHPEVAYRFEPFHRLRPDPGIRYWRARIEAGDIDDEAIEGLYELLIEARPQIDKPPFFPKDNARNLGRRWLWPSARRVPPLGRVWSSLFAPSRGAPLVFKEVSLSILFEKLAQSTTMRLVYIVRDPRGVVASLAQGRKKGVMPSGRWPALASLMAKHDPALAARYTPELSNLSGIEKDTLLWRMDVERAARACRGRDHTMLVSYDALCEDPLRHARGVFEHCGLALTQQTERFIEVSTGASSARRSPYGDSGGGRYFSVYRDPRQSMSKWKEQLSSTEIDAIEAIVEGSEAFETFERVRGAQAEATRTAA